MEDIPFVKDITKPLRPKAPAPLPPPPAAAMGAPPDAKIAADRARMAREQADAASRKRGRRSTVVTGPEGVGSTPLGFKTLVGS